MDATGNSTVAIDCEATQHETDVEKSTDLQRPSLGSYAIIRLLIIGGIIAAAIGLAVEFTRLSPSSKGLPSEVPSPDDGIVTNIGQGAETSADDVDNLMGCIAATTLPIGSSMTFAASHPDSIQAETCFAQDSLYSTYATLGNWYHITAADTAVLEASIMFERNGLVASGNAHVDIYRGKSCDELICVGRSANISTEDVVKWVAGKGESYFLVLHYDKDAGLDHYLLQLKAK